MKNKKSVKIILIISLVVAIVFLIGILLKNPSYASGEGCFEIAEKQNPAFNCTDSENEFGYFCVSDLEICSCLQSDSCICEIIEDNI